MTTHPERTGHQATSRVGLNQRQAPGNPRAGGGPSGSYAAHTSFRTGDYPASAQSNAIAAETDLTLALLGARSPAELDPSYIAEPL